LRGIASRARVAGVAVGRASGGVLLHSADREEERVVARGHGEEEHSDREEAHAIHQPDPYRSAPARVIHPGDYAVLGIDRPLFCATSACAAARRAIVTRNGEQDT